ncbi:hypothetical protein MAUB1S_10381 [Mycolicibacterium aubagnense]
MGRALGNFAVALGILAGVAKAFGIVRWLFLMPGLAVAYVDPGASGATKAAIEVVYVSFNAFAGGVGELLGVGLFAGVWTILVSIALLRLGGGARIIGCAGFIAAAGLLSTLPSVIGVEIIDPADAFGDLLAALDGGACDLAPARTLSGKHWDLIRRESGRPIKPSLITAQVNPHRADRELL